MEKINESKVIFNRRLLLITQYRLLKFLERCSHKTPLNYVIPAYLKDEDIKAEFKRLVLKAKEDNLFEDENYYDSKEIVIQGVLFNALKKKKLLAETIAEIESSLSKRNISKSEINEWSNFLNYCIDNPKEINKYKVKNGRG